MKEGWEYKTLGEVGSFKRGGNFSKKDFVKDGFPCIHYGQIHTKFGIYTKTHLSCVPANIIKKDRCAKKGDVVIAITSEDDEGSCKCTAWMADYEAYVGGHTAIYSHTLNPLFVSYFFKSPVFQIEKLNYTHGFKVVEISPKDIAKIKIPVPSLSEQESIVSYLDSSFKSIDEIKDKALKSLTEAKALFQSALAEAMEPKEGWEEKTLGEISENTKNINWKNESSAYKYIDLSSVDRDKSIILNTVIVNKTNAPSRAKQLVNNNDIIFATTRPLLRRVTLIEKEYDKSICSTGFCVIRPNNNIIVPKYVLYVFKDEPFYQYIEPLQNGASYPAVTDKAVKSYTFSFPKNLEVQKRIVSYLDSLSSKVRGVEEKYQRIVAECDAMKQAMLREVFE